MSSSSSLLKRSFSSSPQSVSPPLLLSHHQSLTHFHNGSISSSSSTSSASSGGELTPTESRLMSLTSSTSSSRCMSDQLEFKRECPQQEKQQQQQRRKPSFLICDILDLNSRHQQQQRGSSESVQPQQQATTPISPSPAAAPPPLPLPHSPVSPSMSAWLLNNYRSKLGACYPYLSAFNLEIYALLAASQQQQQPLLQLPQQQQQQQQQFSSHFPFDSQLSRAANQHNKQQSIIAKDTVSPTPPPPRHHQQQNAQNVARFGHDSKYIGMESTDVSGDSRPRDANSILLSLEQLTRSQFKDSSTTKPKPASPQQPLVKRTLSTAKDTSGCVANNNNNNNSAFNKSSDVKPSPAIAANATANEAGKTMWPAWVYCTRYSDRPSAGKRTARRLTLTLALIN